MWVWSWSTKSCPTLAVWVKSTSWSSSCWYLSTVSFPAMRSKMLLSWTCKAVSTAQNWYAVSIMLASNPASVNFSQMRHGGTDECYAYTVVFVFWDFWLGNAVNWSNSSVYKWVNLCAGSKWSSPLFTESVQPELKMTHRRHLGIVVDENDLLKNWCLKKTFSPYFLLGRQWWQQTKLYLLVFLFCVTWIVNCS